MANPITPAEIVELKRKLGDAVRWPGVPLSDATAKGLALMSLDGRTIYCSGWVRESYIPARAYRRLNYSISSVTTLERIY